MSILGIYTGKLNDLESGSGPAKKVKAGTAIFLIELEKRRSIKAGGYVSLKTVFNFKLLVHKELYSIILDQ